MSKIVTYQAIYRIGPVKARKDHAGMQARRVGETFKLDLDSPIERALRDRLFRLGAILPIDEPDLPIVQGISDNEGEVEVSPPVVTEVTEVTEPPEYSETEVTPQPSIPTEPLPLDASIGTLLDDLTPEIVDTLKRAGVKTIRDLERREDNELRSIGGIGAKRLNTLREAYNTLKTAEMEAERGKVSDA